MKKVYFLFVALFMIAGTSFFIVSCKKEKDTDQNGNCPIGGFNAAAHFMLWVSKNYDGGPYDVKVFDVNGKDVTNFATDFHTLSVYEATEPNACDKTNVSYSKHAILTLQHGNKFTYSATSDNHVYKGTITVPCDDSYDCVAIQIDK